MIVPKFWAEGRIRDHIGGHQVTLRRFGWSDVSQEEAQAHADRRTAEALALTKAGSRVAPREPKVAYNGAEGLPIREEIVCSYGAHVVTRNLYGALCLNTANVLFADVDFPVDRPLGSSCGVLLGMLISGLVIGVRSHSLWVGVLAFVAAAVLIVFLEKPVRWLRGRFAGDREARVRRKIETFFASHPTWRAQLYRTPAGFRVLVLHRTFSPAEPEAEEFFRAIGTDKTYVRMCTRQQCFRARVTPKPWRIGIPNHIRPRPGVWPINPARTPERQRWIAHYEQQSRGYAACAFIAGVGEGSLDKTAEAVRAIHDELSRANSGLPIA